VFLTIDKDKETGRVVRVDWHGRKTAGERAELFNLVISYHNCRIAGMQPTMTVGKEPVTTYWAPINGERTMFRNLPDCIEALINQANKQEGEEL